MTMGRPPTYGPGIIAKAQRYLASCQDVHPEDDIADELEAQPHGGALRRNRDHVNVKIPTVGGLARYLGVARSTLYVWQSEHEDFSDVMDALGAEQEDRLIQGGLSGTYNPTISKVLLTKHGYREGTELTGANGDKLFDDKKNREAEAKAAGAIEGYLGHTEEGRP